MPSSTYGNPGAVWGSFQWGSPGAPGSNSIIQVQNMIYHAFRIAQVLKRPNGSFDGDDWVDSIWEFNQMLSLWQTQRCVVWAILRTVFNINIGQGGPSNPYLVGNTGTTDIVMPRPERIEWASYTFTNGTPNIEQPFKMLTAQEWAALSPKDLTSGNPTQAYYEPAVPNGKLYMFPVPSSSYVTLGALYTWETVSQFANPTDSVITPPAYVDAMTYGLAVRLAMRFPEANISPLAVEQAAQSLAFIKSLNAPHYISQVERGNQAVGQSRGNFNILSNQYVP